MAAFAGDIIDLRCDGCDVRLSENSEIYCSNCSAKLTPEQRAALEDIKSAVNNSRGKLVMIAETIEILCGSRIIAPPDARDALILLARSIRELAA